MKAGVSFTEFPPFTPTTGLARASALLIEHEVWGYTNPSEEQLDSVLLRHIIAAHDEAGNVMAAGALAPLDSGEHVITELGTARQHRGEGLGREIVELLEKRAKELGATSVSLYALEGSKSFFSEVVGYTERTKGSSEMVKSFLPAPHGPHSSEMLPDGEEQLSPEKIGELLEEVLEREQRQEELANDFAQGVFGVGLAS